MKAAASKADDEQFLQADMKLHQTIWKLSRRAQLYRTLNSVMNPFIFMVARAFSSRVPVMDRYADHERYLDMILTTPLARVDSLGKWLLTAPTAAGASFNLPTGVAPTSPVDGDLYRGTHALYLRDGSAWYDLFGLRVDSSDTTPGYLDHKIVAGTGITKTILNVGGDEQLQLTATGGGGITGTFSTTHLVMTNVANTSIKDSPVTYDGTDVTANNATFKVGTATPRFTVDASVNPVKLLGNSSLLLTGSTVYAGDTSDALRFFGTAASGATRQTVTGLVTGATTLAQLASAVKNLLTALAAYNLLVDSTT